MGFVKLTYDDFVVFNKIKEDWINLIYKNPYKKFKEKDAKEGLCAICRFLDIEEPNEIIIIESPIQALPLIDKYRTKEDTNILPSTINWHWFESAVFAEFYLTKNLFKDDIKNKVTAYLRFLKSNVLDFFILKEIAIFIKPPYKIVTNKMNQLHNINGPAIEWGDGHKRYYIEDIGIPEETFIKMMKRQFTFEEYKEAMREKNVIKYLF